MGKRELVALLCLYSVGWLFLTMPWGCLQFVIVVFPGHTHLLFSQQCIAVYWCDQAVLGYVGLTLVNYASNGCIDIVGTLRISDQNTSVTLWCKWTMP